METHRTAKNVATKWLQNLTVFRLARPQFLTHL